MRFDCKLPFVSAIIVSAALLTSESRGADERPRLDNIAINRPYTLVPIPNYSYCTDSADKTQITDGQYSSGYFWTQKSTVGWNHARPVVVTIDLGSDQPIRGGSFNTAAGVAGVEWPASILMLVSVDGRAYHDLGDLITISRKQATPPPAGQYGVHRYQTDQLQTHGRYVKLIVDPAGAYCFVDEIEVFRGDDSWMSRPLPGEEIRYPMEYYADTLLNAAVKRRLGRDLETARAAVVAADVSRAVEKQLMAEVVALEQSIDELPPVDPDGFKAVFPLNDVHARIFALHGAVRTAEKQPPLLAWRAVPWDFLTPTDLPDPIPDAEVTVAAMRGESRAGAVNLTNCTQKPMAVTLNFDGLPGGSAPSYVTVHEVAWTDTREGTAVAAALPVVKSSSGTYPIHIPAGMTRQVWFTFTPRGLEAGTHRGRIVIGSAQTNTLKIPVSLRVFDLDFPVQPTLHVGGWDYTDADSRYGVTEENRDALIAHLRARYVDSPWGTSAVLPFGSFSDEGDYRVPPDTARFDTWLTRWPNARRYCVFVSVGKQIAGTSFDQPLFEKKVRRWIQFWAKHTGEKGLRPNQLVLLLLDEPHQNEQDRIITAWARAIKAAETGVVLWEDPTYRDPTQAMPDMLSRVDVLCPNRPMMLAQGQPFIDFYRQQRAAGRRLDLYSCSGPARLLDPYTYHRLQAWSCFALDAESSFFWAFGDTGEGDSWNEYTNKRTSFTPLFLGRHSVTAGKHMEAIRESVEDFEYLTMLRRRIEKLERAEPASALLRRARTLLSTSSTQVLTSPGATDLDWRTAKDHTQADQARIAIGEFLE